MSEVIRLYSTPGWPALQAGGFDPRRRASRWCHVRGPEAGDLARSLPRAFQRRSSRLQPIGHVRPLSEERVQINAAGQVELKLKTPWRDGTTHLVMSPLEFMQRLAALVPRPRLHLIMFHGVLAPNAKLRALVVQRQTAAGTALRVASARRHRNQGQP